MNGDIGIGQLQIDEASLLGWDAGPTAPTQSAPASIKAFEEAVV